MSTKKYSHNLKVELLYLVGMFRTPSLGDSISVALEKTAPRRLEGKSGLYTSLQKREQAV